MGQYKVSIHDRNAIWTVQIVNLHKWQMESLNKSLDSFAAAGPRLWTTLPSTLQQMTSYGKFRRHLKAHLFRA